MFEVGVGRRQLLALAALACPDGPNDIAPLRSEGPRPRRLIVSSGHVGFASEQYEFASEQPEFVSDQHEFVPEQHGFASEQSGLAPGLAEVLPR